MARVALAGAVRPLVGSASTPALLATAARPVRAALSTSARRLADAPTADGEGSGGKRSGFLSGLLHGSAAAKDLGDHTESHSTSVARGKYGACARFQLRLARFQGDSLPCASMSRHRRKC